MLKKLVILFILILPLGAHAQFEGLDDILGPPTETSTTKEMPVEEEPSFNRVGTLSAIFWQEDVRAEIAGDMTDVRMQFEGLQVDYGFILPYNESSKWRKIFGAHLGLGSVHGKADSPTIQDEFKGQQWASLGVTPELNYRTTEHSSVGVAVPLIYRLTAWSLKGESGIKLDKGTSFSTGLAGTFNIHVTEKSSIRVMTILHNVWDATQWSFGYSYLF